MHLADYTDITSSPEFNSMEFLENHINFEPGQDSSVIQAARPKRRARKQMPSGRHPKKQNDYIVHDMDLGRSARMLKTVGCSGSSNGDT